jgi:hypothetical protein
VSGLKNGQTFSNISAGGHAQPANQTAHRSDTISPYRLGKYQNIKLPGIAYQLHAQVIDIHIVKFYIRIAFGYFPRQTGKALQKIS